MIARVRIDSVAPVRHAASGFSIALLVVLAIACGEKKPPTPVGPHPVSADAGVPAAPADAAAVAAPSEAECGALVDHVLELGMAKFRADARASGKPIPTEAQLAKIRAQLTDELMAGCRDLPRAVYDCAMAAGDVDAYVACEPKPAQ